MAAIRSWTPAALPTVPPSRPGASEAARTARQAMFQQAIAGAQAAPQAASVQQVRPTAATTPAVVTTPVERVAPSADAPRPERPLRPGSLLDIRV